VKHRCRRVDLTPASDTLGEQGPGEAVIIESCLQHLSDSRSRNPFGDSLFNLAQKGFQGEVIPLALSKDRQEIRHPCGFNLLLVSQCEQPLEGGFGDTGFPCLLQTVLESVIGLLRRNRCRTDQCEQDQEQTQQRFFKWPGHGIFLRSERRFDSQNHRRPKTLPQGQG